MQKATRAIHRLNHCARRSLGVGPDANRATRCSAGQSRRIPSSITSSLFSQYEGYNLSFDKHQSAHMGMSAREIVAWNLRRVRVSRGMSSEALAADAGVA